VRNLRQHSKFYVLLTAHLDIFIKKNQLDALLIVSIFRQTPLHVSGVSTAHHQEIHVVLAGLEPGQDYRESYNKNASTNFYRCTVHFIETFN